MKAWIAAAGALTVAACASAPPRDFEIVGEAQRFAPGVASTQWSDVRLTLSPDGRTALWFSRNRPGGAGSYDIWMSRREPGGWEAALPVPFNTPAREFDPAFSADGRFVYFSSDRPGGLGGDDIYKVPVLGAGFGTPENLGPGVNSARNEWAPMLAPDGRSLLFSSDGRGGAGRMDLFTSRVVDGRFTPAAPLPGELNTDHDEFDATWLADGRTVIFTRARNLTTDTVRLYLAAPREGGYDAGILLPAGVNTPDSDTYAPMLDWSRPDHFTFTSRRPADAGSVDLFSIRYRP